MNPVPEPTRNFHIPSLDGVRAVAALMVFLSHAGYGHVIPGGFGVTVFFFLSGYLITTLLRREFDAQGTLHFKSFYLRRIYRILPPMYAVILFIIAIQAVVGFDEPVSPLYLLSLLFQFNNYYALMHGSDGMLAATGPFWSLAVEEHFYLIFPALFVFASRRWSGAGVARLFLLLCLLVLAWRCVLVFGLDAPWDRTYLATDTRIDSMLFGCIMGMWMNPALDRDPFRNLRTKIVLLVAGLMLLAISFIVRDPLFRATLRYTIQGFGLFPIFWLAVRHPEWPAFRLLNTAPARLLGALSYSFYLAHLLWIDLTARVIGRPGIVANLCALTMTLLFSYCIYRLVERPFGRLRRRLHDADARRQAKRSGKLEHTA